MSEHFIFFYKERLPQQTIPNIIMSSETTDSNDIKKEHNVDPDTSMTSSEHEQSLILSQDQKRLNETKLLRDTLDLLWEKTLEQRKVCEQLQQENEYLHDYIDNLMSSSNVLDK